MKGSGTKAPAANRVGMTILARRHPVLVTAFVLALVLSLFFAGRIVVRTVYWSQHREEPVAGWMTVGYVGRSWGLDPREIDARAGLPTPERGRPFTLEQIARDQGLPLAEIIARVEAVVAQMLAEREAPPDAVPEGPAKAP